MTTRLLLLLFLLYRSARSSRLPLKSLEICAQLYGEDKVIIKCPSVHTAWAAYCKSRLQLCCMRTLCCVLPADHRPPRTATIGSGSLAAAGQARGHG